MNDDRSFERTARAWLEPGANQAPDRAVQAVLLAIETTPQERDLRIPWRFQTMNTPFRVAVAAVIGVLLLGGAYYLFGGGGGPDVGGSATPTPAPTASPSPSPTALPTFPLGGMVVTQAGRYVADDPFGVPVSIDVPSAWTIAREGSQVAVVFPPSANQVEISFYVFDNVYADPCHYEQNPDPVVLPDTVEALVGALTSLPTLDVTTPTDIIVDGHVGKELTMTAPATFDGCTLSPDGFALWNIPDHSNRTIGPGESQRVRIVDVAGSRLVIVALESPGTTDPERAAIQAALDSIQIELPASQPSPSVSP